LRADIKSEVKDLMMGHARQSARKHYDYDDVTIKEAYARAFEHLSINGLQVRKDIKKVMEALHHVEDANMIIQRQLTARDNEINELKDRLKEIEGNWREFEEILAGKRDKATLKLGRYEIDFSGEKPKKSNVEDSEESA
jgi:predicted nuclease with TOPRIM domain